jgi:transcriptional regulator with XRE-family HTH domain
MGIARIADAAGLCRATVDHIVYGENGTGPAYTVHRFIERRICRVEPSLELCSQGACIDATVTQRKLQALMANGWAIAEIARELDMNRHQLSNIMRANSVFARTAIRIDRLFDRLQDKQPPTSTRYEKSNRSRALAVAQREGYAPAWAWDDINDLDEVPDPGYKPRKKNEKFDWDDVEHFRKFGMLDEVIAGRLGISVKTIKDYERRRNAAA